MRILIAGGGSGGHIHPALAVARALHEGPAPVDVVWVGGRRGLERELVPAAGFQLTRLWLRSLRSTELSIHAVLDPIRLGASLPQALALLTRLRPAAIFSTGGYVALPVLAAAATLRIPTLLWEGNLVPGRSARVAAPLATVVTLSFEATRRRLGGRGEVTGTPIRSLAGLDRAAARERFGVAEGQPCLLIFGGSQAVARFDAAVAEALPALTERAVVLHLTGQAAYAAALQRREALPAARRDRYRPYPFLREEMGLALVAADLVVGRAGSSTLAEVTAAGLPMVVVPYPHAAGHQRANARFVAEAGAAELVDDEAFDGPALVAALAILDDGPRVAAMRAASRALGRPGAAAANAAILLALAEHRPVPEAAEVERIARLAA
ncbi:MAG TPA: UDP-N-acetylglucosamine--N-acetylmuramyl-(pentapeptide) pyrophosphoryl-undecaprenol N-acetylglucosamine transferase [Candidatus Limnocylindrales bacterium]|jgi:UDP-N-acetylglucosamine--N-acetylmuramyl-(pentapeptide) pyrophosphoryl-undecaprenol N-acetylglucosamine transferase